MWLNMKNGGKLVNKFGIGWTGSAWNLASGYTALLFEDGFVLRGWHGGGFGNSTKLS